MKDAVDLLNEKIKTQQQEIERLHEQFLADKAVIFQLEKENADLNAKLAERGERMKTLRKMMRPEWRSSYVVAWGDWFDKDGEPL